MHARIMLSYNFLNVCSQVTPFLNALSIVSEDRRSLRVISDKIHFILHNIAPLILY